MSSEDITKIELVARAVDQVEYRTYMRTHGHVFSQVSFRLQEEKKDICWFGQFYLKHSDRFQWREKSGCHVAGVVTTPGKMEGETQTP